jgi:hypothetical protein
VPVPSAPLAATLKLLGRADTWERLGGELVVNPEKLMRAGWRPPVQSVEGLAAMTREHRSAGRGS